MEVDRVHEQRDRSVVANDGGILAGPQLSDRDGWDGGILAGPQLSERDGWDGGGMDA